MDGVCPSYGIAYTEPLCWLTFGLLKNRRSLLLVARLCRHWRRPRLPTRRAMTLETLRKTDQVSLAQSPRIDQVELYLSP